MSMSRPCLELDGTIFVFDVKRKDRNVSKRDKDRPKENANGASKRLDDFEESALPLADEILVTRTFLDDKQGQLNEFEPLGIAPVEASKVQLQPVVVPMWHRDSFHKEEMVAMDEKYTQEIDEACGVRQGSPCIVLLQERQKYEVLREEKNDAEMEAEEYIKGLLEYHAKRDQELEQSFQEKMMEEEAGCGARRDPPALGGAAPADHRGASAQGQRVAIAVRGTSAAGRLKEAAQDGQDGPRDGLAW
eukprot:Skav217560  [mRNA]  locus=scaffold1602:398830:405041:+ [translate_table: standard]